MAPREDWQGRKDGNVKGAKTLVLLDANHLMHRAYWAIQKSLATSRGEKTNAVFGVASMLLTLIAREQPDCIVACFDEGKETFRHKEYALYKAGRPETPDDFYQQMPRVRECFRSFSIPILSDLGFEADDLIGTLAKRGAGEGYDVLIVTGDRDLFQMASDHIRIVIPEKGYAEPKYLDTAGVEAKLGVTPLLVPDYKGLTGDPSDNLPGVRGIGPKTAVELLKKYHSLEEIYAHLPEVRENVRKKLEADRQSAFTCRDLATLRLDVPVPSDVLTASWHADGSAIDRFFADVEFHTLRRRLSSLLTDNAYLHAHVDSTATRDVAVPFIENALKITEDDLPRLD